MTRKTHEFLRDRGFKSLARYAHLRVNLEPGCQTPLAQVLPSNYRRLRDLCRANPLGHIHVRIEGLPPPVSTSRATLHSHNVFNRLRQVANWVGGQYSERCCGPHDHGARIKRKTLLPRASAVTSPSARERASNFILADIFAAQMPWGCDLHTYPTRLHYTRTSHFGGHGASPGRLVNSNPCICRGLQGFDLETKNLLFQRDIAGLPSLASRRITSILHRSHVMLTHPTKQTSPDFPRHEPNESLAFHYANPRQPAARRPSTPD
jgi:hypothetical protein